MKLSRRGLFLASLGTALAPVWKPRALPAGVIQADFQDFTRYSVVHSPLTVDLESARRLGEMLSERGTK